MLFQTKNLNKRSIDYRPFNVSTSYDVAVTYDEILARDHMIVSLELCCEYKTTPGNPGATAAAERASRKAIIDKLYGHLLLKLNELERAVHYGDMQLSFQAIKEAKEWVYDLEKS